MAPALLLLRWLTVGTLCGPIGQFVVIGGEPEHYRFGFYVRHRLGEAPASRRPVACGLKALQFMECSVATHFAALRAVHAKRRSDKIVTR